MNTPRDPRFVDAVLDWRPPWFLARLALTGAYLLGGVVKLTDWPAATAEQAHFGMSPPALWAGLTIAVELIGPLLILSGRLVWPGAGMLGVFTLLVAFTANAFWTLPVGSQDRFTATNAFFEHLGLIGGFMMAALIAELEQGRAQAGLARGAARAMSAAAQQHDTAHPPALTITRYDEDWSALAGPANRTGRGRAELRLDG